MHVIFTDEEKEWINMKPFNWTVKDGCPENIKKEIEKKLKVLSGDNAKPKD